MPKAPPRANDLLRFMEARHAIYLRRESGAPPPWTKDPVLSQYRFCNVYRELDTVTKWIDERIREPYADHPHLWFLLAVARQINWPDTLDEMLLSGVLVPGRRGWRPDAARKVMLRRQARGDKLYTGAYMLNAHGRGPSDPEDKAFFTCSLVLDSVWKNRSRIEVEFERGSMRSAWQSLLPHHGWGGFTAYEVVCDARYTRYGGSDLWKYDAVNWAHAGPGAKRGLNRLSGAPAKAPMRDAAALDGMRRYYDHVVERWPHQPRLEMREIEHSLCEFDKYERARLGEGRPRARYTPPATN